MRQALLLSTLILSATPLLAHHNASHTYDAEKPVPLDGTVTAVHWKNPHVLVYVDVKSDGGNVVNWKVELVGPIGGMVRLGLTKEAFHVGDPISLTACVAKDGTHTAAARAVTVPSAMENKRVGIC